ncbi:uncharacterized protein LOC141751390 [Larus michahellis]|uniref:uncharacterized protein LOC141751390 n=1 Tax=Larus michahellis TaxID=119627 RepID=UPI003D9B359C
MFVPGELPPNLGLEGSTFTGDNAGLEDNVGGEGVTLKASLIGKWERGRFEKRHSVLSLYGFTFSPWEEEGSASKTSGHCRCGHGKFNKTFDPCFKATAATAASVLVSFPFLKRHWTCQCLQETCPGVERGQWQQETTRRTVQQECCEVRKSSGVDVLPSVYIGLKNKLSRIRRDFLVRPGENEKQPDKKGMNSQCEQQRPNSLLILLETRCINSPSWFHVDKEWENTGDYMMFSELTAGIISHKNGSQAALQNSSNASRRHESVSDHSGTHSPSLLVRLCVNCLQIPGSSSSGQHQELVLHSWGPLPLSPWHASPKYHGPRASNNDKVTNTDPWEQLYPDHPEGTGHRHQVMSDKSLYFSCFEVEISGADIYLGMTYRSIDQAGSESNSCTLRNNFSWSTLRNGKGFSAWPSDVEMPLKVFGRIGVYPNYPSRTLSFYRVTCDEATFMHQFDMILLSPSTTTFGF